MQNPEDFVRELYCRLVKAFLKDLKQSTVRGHNVFVHGKNQEDPIEGSHAGGRHGE